jgi:hypothetical protein
VAALLPPVKRRKTTQWTVAERWKQKADDKFIANKMTWEACKVENWKYHTQSDPTYPPELVQQLRLYYRGLGKTDKRTFLSPGVRCSVNTQRANGGGDLGGVPLYGNYRLEKEDVLQAGLVAYRVNGALLPTPAVMDCQRVRQKFLHWVVGAGGVKITNRPDKHHLTKSEPKTVALREVALEIHVSMINNHI